jgi:hypothetical protein
MSAVAGSTEPDQGTLARAVGIIFSPGQTFQAVVKDPRPVIILLLCAVVIALAAGLPMFTDRGIQGAIDAGVQMVERFSGQPVSPEMYAGIEQRTRRFGPYQAMGSVMIGVPIASMFFSALYWFLFNAILGGTATFKQVLGIVAHSSVIGALGAVLGAPVMYLQNSFTQTGPFTLAAIGQMAAPSSFVSHFLGGIGLFQIWGLIVTAMGLGVLYRRKTTGIAVFLIGIYLVVVAGFAAVFS